MVQLSKNAQSTSMGEATEKALLMNQGGFDTTYTEKDTRNKITISLSFFFLSRKLTKSIANLLQQSAFYAADEKTQIALDCNTCVTAFN